MSEAESLAPPFERMGGAATIDLLVEAFYRNMDALPEAAEIRALHATNLGPTKQILKLYLGEWLGGPRDYSASRGHPRLRSRHVRFPIGIAERDAWLLCMKRALDETVPDAELRLGVLQAMANLANHMRNKPEAAEA